MKRPNDVKRPNSGGLSLGQFLRSRERLSTDPRYAAVNGRFAGAALGTTVGTNFAQAIAHFNRVIRGFWNAAR